jgi:hypothetical protein
MVQIAFDNLYVCTDCVFYIANGDLPEDDTNAWSPDNFDARWRDYNVCCGDSEKDNEFSWSRCDGCGSKLGGARFHCVALQD